jgi:hypothetical protein
MSRERIYRPRHNLCAQISLEVAAGLLQRARADQTPQRMVVEQALRRYLLDRARQDGLSESDALCASGFRSVAADINVEALADVVSEDCVPALRGGLK